MFGKGIQVSKRRSLPQKYIIYFCQVLLPAFAEDQKTGVRIVMSAIKLPAITIVKNAGGEGAVVIHQLLAEKKMQQGYDAQQGKYVNMFEAGVCSKWLFTCASGK